MYHRRCATNYVAVYAGTSTSSRLISKLCGSNKTTITFQGPSVLLLFRLAHPSCSPSLTLLSELITYTTATPSGNNCSSLEKEANFRVSANSDSFFFFWTFVLWHWFSSFPFFNYENASKLDFFCLINKSKLVIVAVQICYFVAKQEIARLVHGHKYGLDVNHHQPFSLYILGKRNAFVFTKSESNNAYILLLKWNCY